VSERLTIIDALQDPALFGGLSAFEDPDSWRSWLAWLRAVYGLPMGAADRELFRQHTGREEPREGGYAEAVSIVGAQAGKSQVAATVGVYEAARAVMAGERGVYVPLVAQDLRGAQRALFRYVQEAVEGSELLRREVVRETTTELELSGGVTIAVYPCRPAAIRGIRAACCAVDELAFFTATDGRPTDTEMLRALRTRLATTGGKLLILSSPYGQTGALWDLHRRHHGREDSPILVWQATAPEMNPALPADYVERMREEDPEAYRSEVLGQFRKGLSTFLDPDALAAVIEEGVRERGPEDGVSYVAFVDAASGSGKDSFAVGIAHADGERGVLDAVRAWGPPFNPSGVIAEAAEMLALFGVEEVEGDRYAPGFVEEGFRKHGIRYEAAPRTTSDTYLEFLPLVNAGAVVVLDHAALLRELRGLERRTGTSGKDRVDHRPGAHDDRAIAAAGACVAALRRPEKRYRRATWGYGSVEKPKPQAGKSRDTNVVYRQTVERTRGGARVVEESGRLPRNRERRRR